MLPKLKLFAQQSAMLNIRCLSTFGVAYLSCCLNYAIHMVSCDEHDAVIISKHYVLTFDLERSNGCGLQ